MLLVFIDLKVRKIKNEASSNLLQPEDSFSIFAYYFASSFGPPVPFKDEPRLGPDTVQSEAFRGPLHVQDLQGGHREKKSTLCIDV